MNRDEAIEFSASLRELQKDPKLWAEFIKIANSILQDEINNEVIRAIYDAAVENRVNKRIQESGISGYCSCCGAPHMVEDGSQDHDQECIWHEEKDNDAR